LRARRRLPRARRAEGAGEHQALGGLRDVDEAAGAGQALAELADVDVALGIALRQAEHREVEAAAVVEVELIGLVDHGLGVDRRAEVQPAGRDAADHARFGAQGDEVDDALLGRHRRHALGHADAQVHQFAGAQLQRRAPRDHLARPGGHRRHLRQRHAQASGVGRRVGRGEGLRVLLGALGPHHAVDQHAGHLDLAGLQAAALGHLLHLGDDDAAAVVRGHRHGQVVLRQASRSIVMLPSASAVVPRMKATEIGNALVEQQLLAVELITRTRSSVVRALSLPPCSRGSTKVPRPTRDRCPGLPPAMSRYRCEITPCGRL
jgi:hypothetical protein